jgi:hypothetical protein
MPERRNAMRSPIALSAAVVRFIFENLACGRNLLLGG